jgi:hypothetical protein
MSQEEFDALQPLHDLFREVVVEDKERIQRDFEDVKRNVNALMRIVMKREIFKKRDRFVRLLVKTGDAVGDCLRLAAKYRHSVQEQIIQPPPSRLEQRQPQAPVIVQTQAPQQQQTGGVRGFFAGFWEYRIAKLLAEKKREEPPIPVSTTPMVVDEIRALSEIRPLLNRFTDLVFKCLRRYYRHPNEAIKRYLHWKAEQELAKISLVLIGAARWASKAEISEARQVGVSLAASAARVAEAEAMRPIFGAPGAGLTVDDLMSLLSRFRPEGIDFDRELKRRGI